MPPFIPPANILNTQERERPAEPPPVAARLILIPAFINSELIDKFLFSINTWDLRRDPRKLNRSAIRHNNVDYESQHPYQSFARKNSIGIDNTRHGAVDGARL